MKYLVTGATGFVGGHLIKLLRRLGHDAVAVIRNPAQAEHLVSLGVMVVKGDVTDKESMRSPMTGCDGVFHIAGWYKLGTKDREAAFRTNIDGTRNVLELMRELQIPKGVYTSTLAVNSDTKGELKDESYHFDGKQLSVYDQTKAEAHRIALEFMRQGLPLVLVMPGLIYGPGDQGPGGDALRRFLRRRLPSLTRKSAYCFARVEDIAIAHWLAMEKGKAGESYIICGEPKTLTGFFEMVSEISGVKAPPSVSPVLARLTAAMVSVIEKVIPVPPFYSAESLRVYAGVTYLGNNHKAKRELDYRPRSLEEGLRETVLYEMEQLGLPLHAKN